MTAFDCYLPALATQLGYALPAATKDRRAFWMAFGHMVVYRQDVDGELPFLAEQWPKAAAAGAGDAAGRSPKDQKPADEETEQTDDASDEEPEKDE
jgi:hypothetical protein